MRPRVEVSDEEYGSVLQPLINRRQHPFDEEEAFTSIVEAVSRAVSQLEQGLPPTVAEGRAATERIAASAAKLLEQIGETDTHLRLHIHGHMMQVGGDLFVLRRQLESLAMLGPPAKGTSNPYLEHLLKDLFQIWVVCTADDARRRSSPEVSDISGLHEGLTDRLFEAQLPPFGYWAAVVAAVFDRLTGSQLAEAITPNRIREFLSRQPQGAAEGNSDK